MTRTRSFLWAWPAADGKRPLLLIGLPALACLVPVFVSDRESSYLMSMLFQVFLFVPLAQGWNLVAGYAGQLSLGQHAFFGTGAYVTALAWGGGFGGYFDPFTIVLSGAVSALVATLVGIPLLSRLRGDYFALGTLGLGEILRVVATQGGAITGGSSGLILPMSRDASMSRYYYYGLALATCATLTTYLVSRSRGGLALCAIRDSEVAAGASGIHVLKYKVLAFALSAFFAGLCGNLHTSYLFQVTAPGAFSLRWTLYSVVMCVLGGTGTVAGPVAGAFILTLLFEASQRFLPVVHPLLSGTLIVLIVLLLPSGLIRGQEHRIRPQQEES
jgi:branched-chain amino acid transport system permease protein